tara:strand:- start:4682 stop:6019 length:1338 start_codon:yes stop_codon:yes gene_type:complete
MDSRKSIIKAYVKAKRGPDHIIKRDEFLKLTKVSNRQIYKHFESWKELQAIGDDEYFGKLTTSQKALLSEQSKKYDPNASKEDCIADLRKIQEDNWGKHITRNFYRHSGAFSDSTWGQYFGTFQEFRRQAGLELTRHQHTVERAIAKASSIDHYREYFETEVLPYYNKHKKNSHHNHHIKTIMAMSDLHDKECCEFSLEVFIKECEIKQPDVIVLNGDIYDLLEFGKYKTDPRHWDIVGRFKFVREKVYRRLRKACPNSQIDLIAGNHEMRLLKLLADQTPNVRILLSDVMGIGFKDVFGLDKFEINWASKFDLGAYTKQDIKNEQKKNYRIYFDSFVFAHIPDKRLRSLSGSNGHHHQGLIDSYSFVDPVTHMTHQRTWSQTPAMHSRDAEYLTNVSGWNTGFLEVLININTGETIQKIHFTHDDWTVIDGRCYSRKDHESLLQ